MISHFDGNPHGPSLSFSFFSCGCEEAGAAAAGLAAGAALAPVESPFACVCVVSAALGCAPAALPSSHWCDLATVS